MDEQSRFYSKLGPTTDRGCWPWMAGKCKDGYGKHSAQLEPSRNKTIRSHRVAFAMEFGEIPAGKQVLHRCDTPACCNPYHLFLGTGVDNMRDKVAKGRQARGATHGSVTSPDSVARGDRNGSRARPDRLSRGDSHYSRTNPELVSRGDNHYSRVTPEKTARGERSGHAKLTEASVRTIRADYANGVATYAELAARYSVTQGAIYHVVLRLNWRHVV